MKKASIFLILVVSLFLVVGCTGGQEAPPAEPSGDSTPSGDTAELDFPTKPVTIICPWGAGGGTDVALRAFAKHMEDEIGQAIVIVNMPGGAGAIGYTEAMGERPDGYHLVQNTVDFAVMEAIGTHSFSDEFKYVGMKNKYPMLIAIRGDSEWEDIDAFIEDAKSRPGEISAGVTGAGNINHAAALVVEQAGDVEFNVVPFAEGDAEARAALLGGHVDFLTTTSASVLPYLEDGSIRVLGVMDTERSPELPDVPTFTEFGYDAVVGMWRGILAPKDTPDEIVKYLEAAMEKTFNNPEYEKWAIDTGVGHHWLPGDEFKEMVKADIEQLREVLKDVEF